MAAAFRQAAGSCLPREGLGAPAAPAGCLGGVTGPGGDGADASSGRSHPALGPLPTRRLRRTPRAMLGLGALPSMRPRLGGVGARRRTRVSGGRCQACSSCRVCGGWGKSPSIGDGAPSPAPGVGPLDLSRS